jgi:hypothetical protein
MGRIRMIRIPRNPGPYPVNPPSKKNRKISANFVDIVIFVCYAVFVGRGNSPK